MQAEAKILQILFVIETKIEEFFFRLYIDYGCSLIQLNISVFVLNFPFFLIFSFLL